MFKNLLSLSFIFVFVLLLAGCQKELDDQYDTILERGYIIMGLDDTFAPMGFRDENNQIVGFDVDLAKELGRRLNLEIRLQPIDWAMKEAELNNGNIDLIWNGYTITDARKEKVTFSDPYIANRQIIIVLNSSDIFTKNDLIGKEVALQEGSSALDAVMNQPELVRQFKNGDVIQLATNDFALRELENGQVDAVVVDEILARYYVSLKEPNIFRILEDDFGDEMYGVGFRKGDLQFIEAFNNAFNEMKSDGTASQISINWFKEDIIIK